MLIGGFDKQSPALLLTMRGQFVYRFTLSKNSINSKKHSAFSSKIYSAIPRTRTRRSVRNDSRTIAAIITIASQSLSLNHRVGKGEDTELVDLLEDDDLQLPEDKMNEMMMRQEIFAVLSDVLTEREKDVISLRYGLATSQPYTLEEVGGMFNLSRERVRQIQTKAMRKLRRPQVARRLKGWLH